MSKIEWTDATWNPTTGCTRVSPGCDNCYMFALYPRLRAMGVPGYDRQPDEIALMPDRLAMPFRWKAPRRVFVNSMSDLFHPRVPLEFVSLVFGVMFAAERHTYQVLTKRPGRAVAWWRQKGEELFGAWPSNVWIGTSVESQKYAPRIEVLARIPAPVRFVSAEPLLGPLVIMPSLVLGEVSWLIAGGESGPKARAMDPAWARDLRDQAAACKVPFFFKQWGGRRGKRSGAEAVLDGRTHQEYP